MNMKKLLIFHIIFLFSVFSIFSQKANPVVYNAIKEFEESFPEYSGKVYMTGGNGERTWEKQMEFILSRPGKYPNIQNRFSKCFGKKLPAAPSEMTEEMLSWWEREIMAQAGKPNGFAHVGGKAQDVSVRNLDLSGKQEFSKILQAHNLGIIYEIPPDSYYVSIDRATVFHCYLP